MAQIRPYTEADLAAIKRMHIDSGLPLNCFPDLTNPNFKVRIIADHRGKAILAGFVKLTGEAFILVDHSYAVPGKRLDALEQLVAFGLAEAAKKKLDDVSAWLPPEVEKAFGPRLEDLGFVKSPWPSYTAVLGASDAER